MSSNLSHATPFITSKDGKVGIIPKRIVEVKRKAKQFPMVEWDRGRGHP